MKRILIVCIAIAVAHVLVTSCSTIDCPAINTVRTYYQICNSDGTKMTFKSALSVISKRSNGTDTLLFSNLADTLLLNRGTEISDFSLPVSYSHPEDILVFVYSNLAGDEIYAIDTAWIKKDDIPHFESVDCNVSFFHRLTGVRHTNNFIDSLVIKETSVTYDQTKVHFFLYPDTVR